MKKKIAEKNAILLVERDGEVVVVGVVVAGRINAYDGLSAGLSESFPAELPQPAWPPSWQVQVSAKIRFTSF